MCCRRDDDNREIFSRAVFAGMKPSAFFINVGRGEDRGRGGADDSPRQKRIAGAGLDVFQKSPLRPTAVSGIVPTSVVSPQIALFPTATRRT